MQKIGSLSKLSWRRQYCAVEKTPVTASILIFYTNFDVNKEGIAAITGERLRAGPQVKVTALNHGMGFILWFKDGCAHCLEGYTYDDSTVGIDLEKITFELT